MNAGSSGPGTELALSALRFDCQKERIMARSFDEVVAFFIAACVAACSTPDRPGETLGAGDAEAGVSNGGSGGTRDGGGVFADAFADGAANADVSLGDAQPPADDASGTEGGDAGDPGIIGVANTPCSLDNAYG